MKNSILNKEVSLFADYTTAIPNDKIDLLGWLTTDHFKGEIQRIRNSDSPDEIRQMKAQLPAITPSGIFSGRRSTENLLHHSGFICIDIDGKDNPKIKDWEKAKSFFEGIPTIAYCGLSASGKGIFLLIPIHTPLYHAGYFVFLEYFFMVRYAIKIDRSCKDVSRLRGASYDPTPYINHQANPLGIRMEESTKRVSDLRGTERNNKDDRKAIFNILNEIRQSNLDITENYKDWFKVGAVIANSMGEKGRGVFHEFSRNYPKYDQRKCNKQFDSCMKKRYGYGIGTLKYLLKGYR